MMKILWPIFFLLFFFDVAHGAKYTLKEALEKAKVHPQVRNLDLTREQALTQFQGSLLNWAPSLSAERAWTGYTSSDSSTSPLTYERLSFETEVNVFRGLSDLGQSRSTYFALDSAKEQVSDEWRQIQNQIAMIYFRCFRDKRLLEEAKKAVEIRSELSNIAQRRFNSGSLAKDEYVKLKIDRQLAVSERVSREQSYESCLEDLQYWTEKEVDLVKPELKDEVEKSLKKEQQIEQHPGWQSRKALTHEREWDVTEEAGNFWPEFNVSFSKYPHTDYQPAEETVFFSIQWDIFDRGQTWTNYQLANIAEKRARRELRDYKKSIVRDNKIGLKQTKKFLEQYEINAENSELAGDIFQTSLERFEKGAISSNEVALDQSRVIDAAFSEWESWFDLYSAWLRILDARGKSLEKLL